MNIGISIVPHHRGDVQSSSIAPRLAITVCEVQVIRRRRRNIAILVALAALLGIAAAIVSRIGDTERVGNYWVSAVLDDQGEAQIDEIIEYDFGSNSRHGIFRDVPELDPDSEITVRSSTAPDGFTIETPYLTRIRIGDPNETVRGRHTYEIGYSLATLREDDVVSWNSVGTHWRVGFDKVEIHLRAPHELLGPTCNIGTFGSRTDCSTRLAAPGHLIVDASSLAGPSEGSDNEGITLSARVGQPVALSAEPARPTRSGEDPGSSFIAVLLFGSLGALAAMPLVSRLIRRFGREQVWEGGAADAAYGGTAGESKAFVRLDAKKLAEFATIEFVPPAGLTPWQGGVVDKEHVRPEHQVAWLVQRAIEEQIVISGDDDVVIRQGPAGLTDPLLQEMFGGYKSIALGEIDPRFRGGWEKLKQSQEDFAKYSPLWHSEGDSARVAVIIVGLLAALVGLVAAGIGAVAAGRTGDSYPLLVGGGMVFAGGGIAAAIRSWELRVRTPVGSAEWLKVESFRQFLAGSEAHHADWAAEHGILRQYTAWAIALGEIDRWSEAVKHSSVAKTDPRGFYLATLGPRLGGVTRATAATTSSSSGGGGFGGSVGGGGGGGGGGSW